MGQTRWKWAALEAAGSGSRGSGWAPSGPASSWECRAAQSRQARPEEAQEPSWGAAKAGTLSTSTTRRCRAALEHLVARPGAVGQVPRRAGEVGEVRVDRHGSARRRHRQARGQDLGVALAVRVRVPVDFLAQGRGVERLLRRRAHVERCSWAVPQLQQRTLAAAAFKAARILAAVKWVSAAHEPTPNPATFSAHDATFNFRLNSEHRQVPASGCSLTAASLL